LSTTESGAIPVREGDLVAGKYRIEKEIGAGGMGVIVAARHEQLDQRVAIKFVRGETLGNEEGVQRFLREARAAVRLRSEHAARVLDVGTLESGVPFMVMEYLEGQDLGRVLVERGPISAELAADWIAQACEALAEAHAAGIVHRDLKPQNLFLARTVGGADHVKVLDFGVSKSIESMTGPPGALTRTSAILGSPLYMAPEQMRSSRDVDARADVWALGVVLFELLTRRWPFEAETLPGLCLKVVGDPPMSLAELRPDVPEHIVAVIERCLAKDPADRYANAAELSTALEPLLPLGSRVSVERARLAMSTAPPARSSDSIRTGEKHITRPVSPPGRAVPTPAAWGSGKQAGSLAGRRVRVAAVGIASLLVGVAAVGAVGFALHDRMPASPDEQARHAAAVAPNLPPVPNGFEPANRLPVLSIAPSPAEIATGPRAPSSPGVAAPIATQSPPSAQPTGASTAEGSLDSGASAVSPARVAASAWAGASGPAPASTLQTKTGSAAPGASAAPPAASKSKEDDDIPSLR
jgi:serine/threonine-protein kinase